jgi:hypothetical protein
MDMGGILGSRFPAAVPHPPQEELRAGALTIPWIAASAALRTELEDTGNTQDPAPLIYLSVQQTVADRLLNDNYLDRRRDTAREVSVAGTPLFRVVRSGSRDAAAAQAFYDAGGHQWSTAFVCVLKDEEDEIRLTTKPDSFERVKTLGKVLEDTAPGGKVRVFY